MKHTFGLSTLILSAAAALVIALPAQALDLKLLNNGKLLDIGNSKGVSVNIGGTSGVTADVGSTLINKSSDNTLDVGLKLGGGSSSTDVGAKVNLLNPSKGTSVAVGAKTGVLGTDIGLGVNIGLPGLGLGGGGGNGGGGNGGGNGGNGGGNGGGGTGGGVLLASLGSPAMCAAPNAAQVASLLKHQTYDYASLAQASRIKIVPVELCLGVRDQLTGALMRSAGVAQLQHFLATSPSIQRDLMRKGYDMADVLAVDRQGNTLIVYVI